MLKIKLLHPEILQALGSSGHGSRILIADGNYPFSTRAPQTAKKVYLNFVPGMLTVIDVLKTLVEYVPFESAIIMNPPDGHVPDIHHEFAEVLGKNVPLTKSNKPEFYEEARSPDTCLVIATGETRRFANIVLTIGVRKFE